MQLFLDNMTLADMTEIFWTVPSGNIAATYPASGLPPFASAVNDNGWLIPADLLPRSGSINIQANIYYNCAGDYAACAGGSMGAAIFRADINGPPRCLVPTSKSSDTCAVVYQPSSKTYGGASNNYAISGTSQDSAGSDTIEVQATGFKISGKGTPLFSYSVYDATTKEALYPPTDFSSAQFYDFAALPVGSYFFGVTVSEWCRPASIAAQPSQLVSLPTVARVSCDVP
jgi:hypothetical protein